MKRSENNQPCEGTVLARIYGDVRARDSLNYWIALWEIFVRLFAFCYSQNFG